MVSRTFDYVKRHHVALLALFIVLGGSAYAANRIGSKRIKSNAIKERHIAADAVKDRHIAANAVGGAELEANALTVKHGIIRTGRLPLDDPDSGGTTTATRTLLTFGPFTLAGNCNNNGGNVSIATTLDVTERSWVTGIGAPGRLEPADMPRVLPDGVTGFGAGEAVEPAGANAVAAGGRFINVSVQQIRNGLGQADCSYLVSGFGR